MSVYVAVLSRYWSHNSQVVNDMFAGGFHAMILYIYKDILMTSHVMSKFCFFSVRCCHSLYSHRRDCFGRSHIYEKKPGKSRIHESLFI